MNSEQTLQLVREDYAAEVSRREALFARLQFLLTAATLLIAANLSMMAQCPAGWRWWVLAVPSAGAWILLMWLFRLVWVMYAGHDYLEPKDSSAYLEWRTKRAAELESLGYADAALISAAEMEKLLIEDYAAAAKHNRSVNRDVQAIMVQAQRTVLWLTLTQASQAFLYVAAVTFGG